MKLATCLFVAVSIGQLKEIYTSELTHLLFGGTAGVTTRIVFAAEDGGRSLISTEVNFPFHNNITTSAFIGINGLISFDGEVNLSPQISGNSFPNERTAHVIAPFWSNNDIRMAGRVRYEVYDSRTSAASMDVLNRISNTIANRTGESFQGTWMLLVEWEDCHPSPHGQSSLPANSYLQKTNTYQAIAITDGLLHSYAVFIYECGGIQWGAEAASGSIFARVGVSAAGGRVIASHPLSGSNSVDSIDCLNAPTSHWVNLIYDVSLIDPSNTSEPLPQTTSITSPSPVPTESSQFNRVASSNSLYTASQFKASQLTQSVPNSVDGKKSQTLTAVLNPTPSLSPYFPLQTGPDDHPEPSEPEPTISQDPERAPPIEIIVVVVVVLPVATGLIVCFTVLVLFAKYQKKKMKIMAQDIAEVRRSQCSLQSTSLVVQEMDTKLSLS